MLYNGSESEVGKIGLSIQREFETMIKVNNLIEIAEDRYEGPNRSEDFSGKKEENISV